MGTKHVDLVRPKVGRGKLVTWEGSAAGANTDLGVESWRDPLLTSVHLEGGKTVPPVWGAEGVKQTVPGVLSLVSGRRDFSELAVFPSVYSLYSRISLTVSVSNALGPSSEV